jgi:hypothetical protein
MEKGLKDTADQKVTSKTTRAELLKAYHAAVEKLEQLSSGRVPGSSQEAAQQALEKALTYTDENVIKAVADLQVAVGRALKDLTGKMIAESNKLADLRAAVDLESSKLKELRDIDYQVNTLAALIETQAEHKTTFEEDMAGQREAFETEMSTKREEWKKEQQAHEISVKERDLLLKKQRERDEEEYSYKLSVDRRKEAAEHEVRKAKLERELDEEREKAERELAEGRAALAAQEDELVELRKRVERFPKELEEAVKKADAGVRSALKQQYDFDAKLVEKDADAEKRVSALKISNLDELLAKQQVQIADLSKQLQASTRQVQEMAVKAIESASGTKARALNGETGTEQKKTT